MKITLSVMLAIVALLSWMQTDSQPSHFIGSDPHEIRLSVWNINLCKNDSCDRYPDTWVPPIGGGIDAFKARMEYLAKSPARYAIQLKNIVNKLQTVSEAQALHWDLIGLNETYFERVGDGPFGLGWNIHYEIRPIPCEQSGQSSNATECFDAHLRHSNDSPDHVFTQGEVGLIGRSERLDMVETHGQLLGSASDGLSGKVRRNLIGARFRIKCPGSILPFYSTHLTGEKVSEVEDLIDAVHDWWKPGDLTPVVVGDFNFDSTNRYYNYETASSAATTNKPFEKMSKHFTLAGVTNGADGKIEHIWVGKLEKFNEATAAVTVKRWKYLTEFDNKAADLSDHSAVYAELIIPGEACLDRAPTDPVGPLSPAHKKRIKDK